MNLGTGAILPVHVAGEQAGIQHPMETVTLYQLFDENQKVVHVTLSQSGAETYRDSVERLSPSGMSLCIVPGVIHLPLSLVEVIPEKQSCSTS